MKRGAIFKEHFPLAAAVDQAHLNPLELLVMKQFLRRALSLYFDFLSKDLKVPKANA